MTIMQAPSEIIFVDESGDPGLSGRSKRSRPYFVVAFVYCAEPSPLRKHLRRLLKRLHLRRKYPPHLAELKFYLPHTDLIQKGYTPQQLQRYDSFMPAIRAKAIGIICADASGVFAAIVDKRKAYSTWKPHEMYNFIFAETLIVNILSNLSPPNPPAIQFDRGRLTPARLQGFKQYVLDKDSYFEHMGYKRYRGALAPPIDVPSISEPGIWAADIVAGAFYHKYRHNDRSYSNTLVPVFIAKGERLYWR